MAAISEKKHTQEEILEKIIRSHNPRLIIEDESPNVNRIYHIYTDGEITNQKGGWAYRHRSEFTIKFPIHGYFPHLEFPLNMGNRGYAIVTEQDAYLIRDMMIRDFIRNQI